MKTLLQDLGNFPTDPTPMFIDNQGAIAIGKDSISNRRTKHIDIKYHFMREKVQEKLIKLQHIPSEDMIADCFTKTVGQKDT